MRHTAEKNIFHKKKYVVHACITRTRIFFLLMERSRKQEKKRKKNQNSFLTRHRYCFPTCKIIIFIKAWILKLSDNKDIFFWNRLSERKIFLAIILLSFFFSCFIVTYRKLIKRRNNDKVCFWLIIERKFSHFFSEHDLSIFEFPVYLLRKHIICLFW